MGQTLLVDRAGCRSRPCGPHGATGAGGLAIDYYYHHQQQQQQQQQEKERHAPHQGRLVVAEWGEGRIVRLEDNGARTPLVIDVPDVCQTLSSLSSSSSSFRQQKQQNQQQKQQKQQKQPPLQRRRLQHPTALLYSPRGDLFIMDHVPDCDTSVLLRLPSDRHAEPLTSLSESRAAHAWTSLADRYRHQQSSSSSNDQTKSRANNDNNKDNNKDNDKDGDKDLFYLPEIVWWVDGKRGNQSLVAATATTTTTTATCDDQEEAASLSAFLSTSHMGGMALADQGTMLYVTARQGRSIVLVRIHLGSSEDNDDEDDDDDDNDDDDDDDHKDSNKKVKDDSAKPTKVMTMVPHVVWDFSQPHSEAEGSAESTLAAVLARIQHPGPIVVGRSGRVYMGAGQEQEGNGGGGGILVLDVEQRKVVAQLDTGGAIIRALALGEDGFLYLSTDAGSLLRLRVRDGPITVPTHLIQISTSKRKAAPQKP